jgi:hypothetical protein
MAQYFMMQEYVNYHTEGIPASDIKVKYQQAVLDGVGNWLEILSTHIPGYEILNYCVSLYYNRSMVTLASLIIENFRAVAYCPGSGNELEPFQLVVKPASSGNVVVEIGDFGSGINVVIYQVKYVEILQATDTLGRIGPYPDPLRCPLLRGGVLDVRGQDQADVH